MRLSRWNAQGINAVTLLATKVGRVKQLITINGTCPFAPQPIKLRELNYRFAYVRACDYGTCAGSNFATLSVALALAHVEAIDLQFHQPRRSAVRASIEHSRRDRRWRVVLSLDWGLDQRRNEHPIEKAGNQSEGRGQCETPHHAA
jgi:hypothetical protein